MALAIKKILSNKNILEEVSKRSFDSIDTDQSGKIEIKELKKVLEQISVDFKAEPPTEDEIEEVLKQLDQDKNGTIELNEFTVLITDILKAMLKQTEQEK